MNNNAIGVFDSGVGGLSCVPALMKRLPNEKIIYYGDCERAPYGVRPKEEIIEFSLEIARFLVRKDCKSLSIACNTISGIAIDAIKNEFPGIPVIGIIEPAAGMIKKCGSQKVGLIATKATVESGAYFKALGYEIPARAASEFVPFIEAGNYDGEFEEVIREVVGGLKANSEIDHLVLGCTHFPFAAGLINKLYPDLTLLNPAEALAEETARQLEEKNLLAGKRLFKAKNEFLCSGESEVFKRMTEKI